MSGRNERKDSEEDVFAFFLALPVTLLVEGPASSWGLHASIRLWRFSASVECTAFPWLASPEMPHRLSPGASSPMPLQPPRFLPPSPALLWLLWASVRGGTRSRTEVGWEISGSSSSGIGLYQISPSSSASFSSAGSTLRSRVDTLMLTWTKTWGKMSSYTGGQGKENMSPDWHTQHKEPPHWI